MDSDLQDEPRAIAAFVDRWCAGYDVVYATCVERKERWWKRMLFDGFHRVMTSVSATPIPSDAGNFGLMDGRIVRQLLSLDERDRYLPGLRSWVGFTQIGIEVPRNARYDDQPRVSLRGLFRLAKTAIFSFSSLPLSMFYAIGVVALAVFCVLSCYALGCRLLTDSAIPGWTSHVLTGSFFGAINALGIAMLGEYVVRIYDQVRNRPLYLVDRLVGFERTAFDGRGTERNARIAQGETRESRRGLAKIIRREEAPYSKRRVLWTSSKRGSKRLTRGNVRRARSRKNWNNWSTNSSKNRRTSLRRTTWKTNRKSLRFRRSISARARDAIRRK
ncbi:MAG: hypothetical protein QM811_26375 [Pirellulales bacterium]